MKYIEYITKVMLETDFRDRLLSGGMIYNKFLLQTEQTP